MAVHDYPDPYADLRARFSSHRVDAAGLDALIATLNAVRASHGHLL